MTVRKIKAKRFNRRLRQLVGRVKKKTYPRQYDSGFEHDLSITLGKEWEYHPSRVTYTSTHTYQPDFKKEANGKTLLIEAKGRFRTRNESSKYLAIRECLAENEELIFIFYDANKPMVGAQKRKDGTKQTHGQWATTNNFRWYCNKKGLPNDYE